MMTVDKQSIALKEFCGVTQSVEDLVLGLTGNPGAGKSTVAKLFQLNGAIIVDGDQLGYAMLQHSSPVFEQIVQEFGEQILGSDGEIDRSKLGAVVFQNQQQLDKLNSIVHPPMLERIKARIQSFREDRESGPLLLDAALIYEWGIEQWFDAVIVTAAPVRLRHERYITNKGGTPEQLSQRESLQISEEEKKTRADILIMNDQGIDALQHRVDQLFM